MTTPKLSTPPSVPITWRCHCAAHGSRIDVVARTWFEARAEAAATLGCEPGQVEVRAVEVAS